MSHRPGMDAIELAIDLADAAATERLGEDLAAVLTRGDTVALVGDLGAGKTTLARALIRTCNDDPALEVPSPTFTLVQTYEDGRLPIAHFDLYRLAAAGEFDELGLDEALERGAAVIEWPEVAASRLTAERLTVTLQMSGHGRRAVVTGRGSLARRVARSLAIRTFLATAGWGTAVRRHLQGDASTRAFERVADGTRHGILMDAPQRPDGPPIKDGKPYSRIAHLAENVRPFVAVANGLAAAGFSAPTIHAADLDAGLLLVEDLGRLAVTEDGQPIPERYRVAVDLLAALHGQPRPVELPLPDGSLYRLPDYDRDALLVELSLALDWYVPYALGTPVDLATQRAFDAAWATPLDRLAAAETSWVLRDFHSPNLIWCPERQGIGRIGLVDFQDAVIGPAAYDLASLLQDARVSVPADLEASLLAHYLDLRSAAAGFDRESFRAAYLIMAAQRASKILGIFVRLSQRDGKPAYLAHLPRIRGYLRRLLAEPVLADLAAVYGPLLTADPDA